VICVTGDGVVQKEMQCNAEKRVEEKGERGEGRGKEKEKGIRAPGGGVMIKSRYEGLLETVAGHAHANDATTERITYYQVLKIRFITFRAYKLKALENRIDRDSS
jgi:hypothetical protein